MNDLHDHSQPCDHSEVVRFKTGYPEVWMCRAAACPGGREVTIDYEAAAKAITVSRRVARLAVDAALRIGDVG